MVDIQVSISKNSVLNDTIRYTDIRPDLTNTPYISLPKGNYIIYAIADSGQAVVKEAISLTNDRWIFISYSYKPPIDTSETNNLLKNFGNDTSWINPQIRGFPPRLTIYIMDKEPIHQ